ncbi:MAG: hypothetical protein K2G88_10745 [Oscillospiraceae bacterium]|nr:hypothetical protein [Oscillospiraceae bacterium]
MSIDGKITSDFLSRPECKSATESYYRINRDYHANAFAFGRITILKKPFHTFKNATCAKLRLRRS